MTDTDDNAAELERQIDAAESIAVSDGVLELLDKFYTQGKISGEALIALKRRLSNKKKELIEKQTTENRIASDRDRGME